MNHIASEERSYLKGWHLLLPLPSVEPSIESCQSLGVGDEQAAEENVHLDPQKERPFLKLREGLLKHQQDDDDDDDAEKITFWQYSIQSNNRRSNGQQLHFLHFIFFSLHSFS